MFRKFVTFKRDEEGAAAVEFTFVGLPFIFLLTGLIELGFMFIADNMLQSATASAARQVKTGQIVGSGNLVKNQFQTAVCDELIAITRCNNNITVILSEVTDSTTLASHVANNTLYLGNSFNTGGASDFALIRVEYEYSLLTPLIGPIFANSNNGKARTLIATTVVQNEPF